MYKNITLHYENQKSTRAITANKSLEAKLKDISDAHNEPNKDDDVISIMLADALKTVRDGLYDAEELEKQEASCSTSLANSAR